MAKRKTETNDTPAAAAPIPSNGQAGETVSAYFRRVFKENPKWLDTRSNDDVLNRWLLDHPGEKEVPERIRQILSNTKSLARKKGRKKRGRPKAATQPVGIAIPTLVATPRKSVRGLDFLEEQIDDCLTAAKHLDREGLVNVIVLLRRARNAVVWKMGEAAGQAD